MQQTTFISRGRNSTLYRYNWLQWCPCHSSRIFNYKNFPILMLRIKNFLDIVYLSKIFLTHIKTCALDCNVSEYRLGASLSKYEALTGSKYPAVFETTIFIRNVGNSSSVHFATVAQLVSIWFSAFQELEIITNQKKKRMFQFRV